MIVFSILWDCLISPQQEVNTNVIAFDFVSCVMRWKNLLGRSLVLLTF